MRNKLLLAALAAAVLAGQAATASPVVVKVEDTNLANSDVIQSALPGFGSSGPVTLNWDPTNTPSRALQMWNGGYSGRDAAWCGSGINCALDLTVANTHTVTLGSFFLGGYNNFDRNIVWSVIDLANSTQVAASPASPGSLVSGLSGLVVGVNATSTAGFRILFGPDGFNGGITDITYDFARVATPPTPTGVPLPGAVFVFGAGLAGLGMVLRRRG